MTSPALTDSAGRYVRNGYLIALLTAMVMALSGFWVRGIEQRVDGKADRVQFEEVLRRLERIETKLDHQDEERRP